MSHAVVWLGRQLTIRRMMLGIGVFAVVLAPAVEAVKSPTEQRIALAFFIGLFMVPTLLVSHVVYRRLPGKIRGRVIVACMISSAIIIFANKLILPIYAIILFLLFEDA
jgi:hypothetical protein